MIRRFNTSKSMFALFVIVSFLIFATGMTAQAGSTDDNGMHNGISSQNVSDVEDAVSADGSTDTTDADNSEPDSSGSSEDMVSITGIVQDSDGNPVQKVWVSAGSYMWWMVDCGFETDCITPGGSAETDENGKFSISVPHGEQYDLFVETYNIQSETGLMSGFFQDADGGNGAEPGTDNQWAGETTNNWEERTQIQAGTEGVSDVTITLISGVRIYGTAIDVDGNPLSELRINAQAELTGIALEFYDSGGWAGTSTDERGNFSMTVFPGLQYRISSYPSQGLFMGGYWQETADNPLTSSGKDGVPVTNWADATLLEVAEDTEINIIFTPADTISGSVTDEAGDPIPDMWVNAVSGESDSDDILEADTDMMPPYGKPSYYYGASTDENGEYVIAVQPASDYRVSVSGSGISRIVYYDNVTTWKEATLIDMTQGSVSGIDFVLKTGPSISGTVSGLSTGDTVYIEAWSESAEGSSWGYANVTSTGSETAFKIRGLTDGASYRINVWAEGYLDGVVQEDGTVGAWNDAYLFEAGTANLEIKMDTGRKISGKLSGLSEGDRVEIYVYSDSGMGKGETGVAAEGETAEFTLSGLYAASDYLISVYSDGYISGYYGGPGAEPVSWENAVRISTEEGDASGIHIAMTSGHTISGTISGLGEGKYATVHVNSQNHASAGSTRVVGTGEDVTYEIKCLCAASDFHVSIWADGYIGGYYSAADGITDMENADLIDSSTDPANINFTLSKGKTISGTITGLAKGDQATIEAYRKGGDDIEPIEPILLDDVTSYDEDGTIWWGGSNNWGMTTVTGTGEPVTYTITGLASADDFTVIFRAYGYASQTKTDVDTADNPANVDFTAIEGNRISGHIAGATPGQWIWIQAWSDETGDSGFADVQADRSGYADYVIKGLGNASDYVVSIWTECGHLFYNQQMSLDLAARVDLSENSDTGIDFDFDAIEKHTLSGTIAGVEDNTVVRIDIWSNSGAWGNAKVRGNGDFKVELPAETYHIGVYAQGYVNAYYDADAGTLLDNNSAASPVLLNADTDMGTLTLSTGHRLSGTVTNTDGDLVTDVWVEIFNEAGYGGSAVTSEDGTYLVSGLSNGTYIVSLWSFEGYYEDTVTINDSDVVHDIVIEASGNISSDVEGLIPPSDDELSDSRSAKQIMVLFDSNGKFVNAVETDDAGNYEFNGLEPGEYTVKVELEDGEMEVYETFTVAP